LDRAHRRETAGDDFNKFHERPCFAGLAGGLTAALGAIVFGFSRGPGAEKRGGVSVE